MWKSHCDTEYAALLLKGRKWGQTLAKSQTNLVDSS